MARKNKFERQVRENKIRRIAQRRGFRITKSGRKDPQAIGYRG